jgi:fucose permease
MTALLIGRLTGSHIYTKLNSNTYYKHYSILACMGCQILIIIITPVHHLRTTIKYNLNYILNNKIYNMYNDIHTPGKIVEGILY